jgi:hypothetical protein
MKPLLSHAHTFISLATPHIGTLYADSHLVSTGIFNAITHISNKIHVVLF